MCCLLMPASMLGHVYSLKSMCMSLMAKQGKSYIPFTYDHSWSLLVLPLPCLASLSMTNYIAIMKNTNTADYITSYDNINLSLCIGSFLIPYLIKLPCPLCSVTVGNKLGSWVDHLRSYLHLWITYKRQMTWNKGMLKTTNCILLFLGQVLGCTCLKHSEVNHSQEVTCTLAFLLRRLPELSGLSYPR